MAKLYWLRKRWAARIRSNTAFFFRVALPALLMAIAFVWYMGGFRGFSLQRLLVSTQNVLSGGTGECLIKGNIDDSGKRIYHVPGGHYYDITVIEEFKGERWFCTESQARAAGWRKSAL